MHNSHYWLAVGGETKKKSSAKASSHDTVSEWTTIQSQTFSVATPASVMSFVRVKTTAQPPAIPRVCHSFCLGASLGTSQKALTHPSLDLTAYMTASLKGVKG